MVSMYLVALSHAVLYSVPLNNCRENTKEKIDTVAEELEEREQSTPKGRKTANSQGRRKGRITRSMANEAAAANAAATSAAPTSTPPPPPPPAPPAAPPTPVATSPEEPQAPLSAAAVQEQSK